MSVREALLVLVGLLGSTATAQQQIAAKKTLGPVRDLGVYHVASGTFTRGAGKANISPDYIYRNDAPTGYFGVGWENCWTVEELILPGTGNTTCTATFNP